MRHNFLVRPGETLAAQTRMFLRRLENFLDNLEFVVEGNGHFLSKPFLVQKTIRNTPDSATATPLATNLSANAPRYRLLSLTNIRI